MRKIASITQVVIAPSNEAATIYWRDTKGKIGSTYGLLANAHMQAIMARAEREGVQ